MVKDSKLNPLQRLFNLLKLESQDIISIYVYAAFTGLISLSLPIGVQAIINLIQGGEVSTSWIILVIIVIGGVLITGVLNIMQLRISENLQQKIFTKSAFDFSYRFPKMKGIGNSEYMPELANRFFDTLSVQKGLSKIILDFSTSSLQIIFGLILLSFYHPFFFAFSMALLIIAFLIFRFTFPAGIETSLKESKYKYQVAHWIEEIAKSKDTFKLAGKTNLHLKKTDGLVSGYIDSRNKHFRTLLIQYINLVVFKVLIISGLLIIGGILVINQQMNIGQFVASEIVIITVISSVEKLITSMDSIYDVLTSVEKIGNITDIDIENDDKESLIEEDETCLNVTMKNLSYKFSNEKDYSLQDINLKIEKGSKICLSGTGGSGKSILLQIISGLYDNFEGSLSYNNIAYTNWNKNELRFLIGDNLAREEIFNATIYENISLGKEDVTLQMVQKAVDVVGLNDYIAELPKGFNTMLMSEGININYSVKLKIILARSICANNKMVVLEDTFNQLPSKDKLNFVNHLIKSEFTVIATSNDEKIASMFEKSLVLDNGELLAFDNIDKLRTEPWFNNVYYK